MMRAPAPANGRCCRLDTGCYVSDSLSHWRSLPQFNPLYRDAPESPRAGARGAVLRLIDSEESHPMNGGDGRDPHQRGPQPGVDQANLVKGTKIGNCHRTRGAPTWPIGATVPP